MQARSGQSAGVRSLESNRPPAEAKAAKLEEEEIMGAKSALMYKPFPSAGTNQSLFGGPAIEGIPICAPC